MSIEINWEKLFSPENNDQGKNDEPNLHTNINEQIREFLDKQFQQIKLPSYIQSVYITTFDLGTIPPEVEIKNITDPFPEFYSDDENSDGNEDDNDSESVQGDSESEHDGKVKAKSKGKARGDLLNGSREIRTKNTKRSMAGGNKNIRTDISAPTTPQSKYGTNKTRPNVTFPSNNGGSVPSPSSSPSSDETYTRYAESHRGTSKSARSQIDGFKSDQPASPSTPPPRLHSPYLPAANSGLFTYFHPSLSSSGYMSGMRTPLSGNWGPLTRGMSGISLNEFQRQEEVKKKNILRPGIHESRPPSGSNEGQHSVHYNDEDVIIDDDDVDEDNAYDDGLDNEHEVDEEEYDSEEVNDDEGFASPRDDDVQFLLKVAYNGDIKLGVTATLLINYPSPSFISLPINLTITGLEINTMAVIAYINPRKLYFSFICDVNDDGDAVTRKHGYNSGRSERVEIIKDMKIESEIGVPVNHGSIDSSSSNILDSNISAATRGISGSDLNSTESIFNNASPTSSLPSSLGNLAHRPLLTRQQASPSPLSPQLPQRSQSPQSPSVQRQYNDVLNNPANNGSVLRNVGMVERFVLEKVRGIIRDEVAWPGWIALEF